MATDADLLSLTESSNLLFFAFDRSAEEFTYINGRFLEFSISKLRLAIHSFC
ncbi:hypothetical protein [Mucilaginibacter pineti]|uniref:hypothetical protein n=1 Tax=Mucilaginibacter pineti TaxID=1391627 RepID=UPI0013BE9FAD|nr:hypothetical protein [Mucilaginibacter pineti]